LIRWNNTSKIKNYFTPDLLNGHASYNPQGDLYDRLPGDFNTWSPLAKSQFLEINLFMSGYLLSSQGDRMAMANSVEGRYPFLDHRIIEFCSALPENFKLKGLNEKYLLKKLMAHKIPKSIVKRSKQAYRAPISHMFSGSESSDKTHEILSESKIKRSGLFDSTRVEALKKKYTKGQNLSEVDDMALIGIISSQFLHDQFIENHNNIRPDTSNLNIKKEVSI
jgi:asparagine synthase (glutamine-hydrolysing)